MASRNIIERKKVYDFIVNGLTASNLFDLEERYLKFVKRLIYNDNFDDSGTIKE
jgi:hypothetical protein